MIHKINVVLPEESMFFKRLLECLIKKGKKEKALLVLLSSMEIINQTCENSDALTIIYQSVKNIRPIVNVKKVRKSSKMFYLPQLISSDKKNKLALQWLMKSAMNRMEYDLDYRLANELLACIDKKGMAIRRKNHMYDTIMNNRPFLNFLIFK